MSLFWQPFVSDVIGSPGSVVPVSYTFSCNISQLDSNLANLEATVEVLEGL